MTNNSKTELDDALQSLYEYAYMQAVHDERGTNVQLKDPTTVEHVRALIWQSFDKIREAEHHWLFDKFGDVDGLSEREYFRIKDEADRRLYALSNPPEQPS